MKIYFVSQGMKYKTKTLINANAFTHMWSYFDFIRVKNPTDQYEILQYVKSSREEQE